MAYTTNTKVGEEFKNLTFSSSTFPTDTVVTRFISEADAYIDGRLGSIYETPITGTTSLLIIQQISTWLTSARVRYLQQVKTGSETVKQYKEDDLYKKAMEMLTFICSRALILPDATLLSGGVIWQSEAVENPENNGAGDFEFEKNLEQW